MTEVAYSNTEIVKQQATGQELSYSLTPMSEGDATSYAILSFLTESEKYFPERFGHHTAFKDSSIALANLSHEEKRKMKANLIIVQLFEMASRFRFEMERDHFFFQDLVNEEVYVTKNLSLGDGSLLNMLKLTMRIIDVGSKSEQTRERKSWLGFFGRGRS